MLTPLLMQILVSGSVRISIISEKCHSAMQQFRILNWFFVGVDSIFLRIDCTENVVVWPTLNAQLNSLVSSDVMEIVPSPCVRHRLLPVCMNTHVSLPLHPLWDVWCDHPGGRQWSHADFPLVIGPSGNERRLVYLTSLTDWYLGFLSL